jgi:ribose transport system ATP-binding protein
MGACTGREHIVDEPAPLIEVSRISKSFGSTRALDDVSFDLRPGEVHVLAGENGAGKSTLIRIIAGALTSYEGRLLVTGREARFRTPRDATRSGIATIHQELSLIGELSVVDNLFLGEDSSPLSTYRSSTRVAEARKVLAQLELDIDPSLLVETLPLSVRQLVEIARALARDARVLVMDEPTSALSELEAERLFGHVERLRGAGRGIVYISHRMEEIFRLADRITVLRDGRRVLTAPRAELGPERLVEHMVGRTLGARSERVEQRAGRRLLDVRGLGLQATGGGRRLLDDVSFELGSGEVLGLAGLQGSGASELLHALFGSTPLPPSGRVSLGGEEYSPASPREAIARGVILLASDRGSSTLSAMSVRANATLSSLGRFSRLGFVAGARERDAVSEVTLGLKLSAPSLDAAVESLSGGNQQKVALARCLLANPKLLLLDDPTRGIDVAAKTDVHALIRRSARAGTAVLLVASELDELIDVSDRVLVLSRGRVVASLGRHELERSRLLSLCMGAEGSA